MTFAKVNQKGNRVIVQFTGEAYNEESISAYFSALDQVYMQKKKFIVLFDARRIGWVPWKYIRLQLAYQRQKEPMSKLFMVRAAIIVKSSLFRTVVQNLLTLRPTPPVESKVFLDIDSAKQYLCESNLLNVVNESVVDIKLEHENLLDDDMAKCNSSMDNFIIEQTTHKLHMLNVGGSPDIDIDSKEMEDNREMTQYDISIDYFNNEQKNTFNSDTQANFDVEMEITSKMYAGLENIYEDIYNSKKTTKSEIMDTNMVG